MKINYIRSINHLWDKLGRLRVVMDLCQDLVHLTSRTLHPTLPGDTPAPGGTTSCPCPCPVSPCHPPEQCPPPAPSTPLQSTLQQWPGDTLLVEDHDCHDLAPVQHPGRVRLFHQQATRWSCLQHCTEMIWWMVTVSWWLSPWIPRCWAQVWTMLVTARTACQWAAWTWWVSRWTPAWWPGACTSPPPDPGHCSAAAEAALTVASGEWSGE